MREEVRVQQDLVWRAQGLVGGEEHGGRRLGDVHGGGILVFFLVERGCGGGAGFLEARVALADDALDLCELASFFGAAHCERESVWM